MVSIGLDIAKNMCGIAIFDNVRKEIIWVTHLKIWDDDRKQLAINTQELVAILKTKLEPYKFQIKMFGYELSNFSNPKMTQCFSEIVGILEGVVSCNFDKAYYETKVFNANEWYRFIGKLKDVRDVRKANTKVWVREHMGIASDSEDENDALAIAYWTPNCMTTYQHSEQVAKEKVLKANKTRSELVKARKINTLMKKLMSAKRESTITKIKEQIKELENND